MSPLANSSSFSSILPDLYHAMFGWGKPLIGHRSLRDSSNKTCIVTLECSVTLRNAARKVRQWEACGRVVRAIGCSPSRAEVTQPKTTVCHFLLRVFASCLFLSFISCPVLSCCVLPCRAQTAQARWWSGI